MSKIKSSIEAFFEILIVVLDFLFNALDSNTNQLKGAFLSERKILSRRNKGFNLNGKSITPKLSFQGVLVSGETGSFKTSGVVIKSIIKVSETSSQLIHDPSKELFLKTSGALVEQETTILQLDYSNPKQSLRYNPMARVHTKSEISKLAFQLIMIGDNGKGDQFWKTKAVEVLYVLISILKTQDLEFQTLTNVAYLLDLMQSKEDTVLVDALFSENASEELFVKYSSVVSQSANTLSSIMSTAQSAVQLFAMDENVAEVTSSDTIGDFKKFREEKTALYLHSSTVNMEYYAKINSIFMAQFFDAFFEALPTKEQLDCYFHLDEIATLSIDNLDVICANIRKYSGGIMAVTQNAKSQLTAKYGRKAEAILTNLRTKVYLSADLQLANSLERTIGKHQFKDKKQDNKLVTRSVMSADTIMSLPWYKAIIHVSGMRPILARIKPYFKERAIRELTELPAFETPITTTKNSMSLLDLNEMYPNVKDEANEND